MESRVISPQEPVKLLELNELYEARFNLRRNRFTGDVLLEGETVRIHVPDPGRLTELLYPGNSVLVRRAPADSNRKTAWSLIAAREPSGWVLVNTFLHRSISQAILSRPDISPFGAIGSFRAEVTPEGCASRFDFLLTWPDGRRLWLETKGCTLKEGSCALFPDAPTTRGTRHLRELAELAASGQECALMFLIFPGDIRLFSANRRTDPDFADALDNAVKEGVGVYPLALNFDGRAIWFKGSIPFESSPG